MLVWIFFLSAALTAQNQPRIENSYQKCGSRYLCLLLCDSNQSVWESKSSVQCCRDLVTLVASSINLRTFFAIFYYLETKTEATRSQILRWTSQLICRNPMFSWQFWYLLFNLKHEHFLESSLSNVAYEYKLQVHRLSRIFWVQN